MFSIMISKGKTAEKNKTGSWRQVTKPFFKKDSWFIIESKFSGSIFKSYGIIEYFKGLKQELLLIIKLSISRIKGWTYEMQFISLENDIFIWGI